MSTTSIEWTDTTWNPTTGCDRVSPGCDHCYALTMAKRLKGMGSAKYQRDGDPRTSGPGFGVTEHATALDAPLSWRKPRKVFVNSMSDLFHNEVSDEFIARVWQAMGGAPQHQYQILTKRPARMRSWTRRWYSGEIEEPYAEAPVPGFPGYVVTTRGQILGKRADTRSGMRLEQGEQGHMRVRLHREGSPRAGESVLVHRAVLHAFSRAPRADEQALHLNGDATDNRWSNLRWGTQSDNWEDRIAHGSGQSWSKLTELDVEAIRARGAAGESAYSIAKDYPVSDTQVRNVLTRRQWSTPIHDRPLAPGERRVLDCAWLGVSVEDQKRADLRIPALLDTPAAVRFLSCEPLLGPVDLGNVDCGGCALDEPCVLDHGALSGIGWVIAGGESGPGARPMHPAWARRLRDQCVAADVPFLFKQWGSWGPVDSYREWFHGGRWIRPDGEFAVYDEWPGFDEGQAAGLQFMQSSRAGKKAVGRELDGRTWDEYPAVAS